MADFAPLLGLAREQILRAEPGTDTFVDLDGRTFRVFQRPGDPVATLIVPSPSCYGCDGSGRSVWASTRGRPCSCLDHSYDCEPGMCDPHCPSVED